MFTIKSREGGFTLIELMVTLAVALILIAAAVPGFMGTVKNNRLTTETNRLVSDVQLARGEAMRRGARVVLCTSADPTAAAPTCGGAERAWSNGWLVFTDVELNGTFNGADVLLRATQTSGGDVTIMSNTAADGVMQFNPDATTNAGGNTLRIAFCDNRGSTFGKQIEIPPVGRPRLAANVASCTDPPA